MIETKEQNMQELIYLFYSAKLLGIITQISIGKRGCECSIKNRNVKQSYRQFQD